jgi:hypothetical protein
MIGTFGFSHIMKTLLAISLSIFLFGCTSTGTMGQIDSSKPRSVFIEPINQGDFDMMNNAEISLGRKGYDAIKDEKAASYRFKAAIFNQFNKISVSVRLVDSQSGNVVYFGECNNPGIGTLIDPRASIFRCMDSALDNLK